MGRFPLVNGQAGFFRFRESTGVFCFFKTARNSPYDVGVAYDVTRGKVSGFLCKALSPRAGNAVRNSGAVGVYDFAIYIYIYIYIYSGGV